MAVRGQIQDEQIPVEKADLTKPKPKPKYDFPQYLIKGAYIDAKDSVGNWCLTQIVERDDSDDTIKVNFDGWSHKWDEWFKFASMKIAPLRKHSQAYTGQVRYAIRDWKYSPEELEEKSKKLNEILENGILNSFKSSHDITQTLRGTDFIYLDALLQYEYRNAKEEFPHSVNYFIQNFRLYIQTLKMIPEYLPEYNEGITALDAFLLNERIASINCITEISDSVNKILGSCQRCWSHFSVYDREDIPIKISKERLYAGKDYDVSYVGKLNAEENQDVQPQAEEDLKYSHLIVELINAFGELGGFDEWIRVFTYCAQDAKTNELTLIPFKLMMTMLTNIATVYHYLNKDFVAKLMPKIKDAISRRFKTISNKEMKDLDKDLAMKLLQKAQSLLCKFYNPEEIYEFTEVAELELAFKFLTCQYLEKRLKGINEIKEISERIEHHEHYLKTGNSQLIAGSQKSTKYLNANLFIKWIFDSRILEVIFGDSIHIEIVKRCSDIPKFMAKYQTIPIEVIELLWSSCEGKHEAIVRAIYDIIIEISSFFTKEGAQRMHEKILSIPNEELNEIHLNLLKGFAVNTLPRGIDFIESKSSSSTADDNDDEKQVKVYKDPYEEVKESDFYCVTLLWNLLLDDNSVNTHVAELALTALSTILKERACQKLKRLFLYKCFEKLKKNESVSQCINLVHYILNNAYYNTQLEHENSISSILKELDTKFSIVELIVTDMESFHSKVKKLVVTQKDYSRSNLTMREKALVGKYNYNINFNNRLVFLEYMITYPYYSMSFTEKHLDRLWQINVVDSLFDFDQAYFLKWISRRDGNRLNEPTFLINKKEVPYFFNEILSNKSKMSYETLTQEGFFCFDSYFRYVNHLEEKFKVSKSSNFKVVDLKFLGKEQLWEIFLSCKQRETLDSVVNLLVECHLKLDEALSDKKIPVWEELTSKCMSLLKEGYETKKDEILDRAVLLLMRFFDKFEGNTDQEGGTQEQYRYMQPNNVIVILKPTNTPKTVQISYFQTLGTLRKKIADVFGLNVNEFKLHAKGAVVERDDDELQFGQYGFSGPFVVHKVQATVSTETNTFHPKSIVSSNPQYIDLLFSLLSSDNSETVKLIWDLLMRLPTNINIKKKIYLLEDNFNNIFDAKNIYRLLYCLQIAEDFAYDREKERGNTPDFAHHPAVEFKEAEWVNRFLQKEGLQYLISILITPSGPAIKGLHSLMAVTVALKLICYFQTQQPLQQLYNKDFDSVSEQLVPRLLNIINEVCEYSLLREKAEAGAEQPSLKITTAQNETYRIPVSFYYESESILYAQTLFLIVVDTHPRLLDHLYQFKHLENMINIGLLESNNSYLKDKLSNGLLNLFTKYSESNLLCKPHQFFIPMLLQKTLENALLKEERSEVFFRLISNTISTLDIGNVSKESLDVDHLLDRLTGFVEHRKPFEKSGKEVDAVLIGILQVLRALFVRFPEKMKYYGQDKGLVRELLHNCLFEMPKEVSKTTIPPPKCKSYPSRNAVFRLLLALSSKCDENLREIIRFVTPIHVEGPWRTKRYPDWYITAKDNEKSLTGYVGLKNLGCICYMNSQLQQLFMIPAFRKTIMQVEDLGFESSPKEDNILYHLKCIFYGLSQSEKQYFNPKGFCHAFKDFDGNPTNVFEQMDSEEFFNIFMDRLENLTKGAKEHNFIKDIFGGVLSNELIADNEGKPLYREREEPFLTIGLQVKNKKTMEQSLKAFIEGEMLEGENAYMWEEANKKSNTLKRACLKRLPNFMIFVLKRFEFDYNTMQRQKVNDYFEFPNRVNLEPYTQQGLRKAEKSKKKGKTEEGGAEEGQTDETQSDEYPPEYFDYKLTGIVIHLGTAESGHYYSLIQDREADPSIPEEKRWIEFNDTIVTPFDPKDIPNEAFGGEEKWRYYSAAGDATGSMHEKMKNAYILFYERVTPMKEEDLKKASATVTKPDEESKETSVDREGKFDKSKSGQKDTKETSLVKQHSEIVKHAVPEDFLKDLHESNKKFHVHKSVFSREYFDFVSDLVFQHEFSSNPLMVKEVSEIERSLTPESLTEFELLKVGIIFFLTSVIRDKARSNIIRVLPSIKKALNQNIPACEWLLHCFTNKKIITEFFLDNPIGDMRKFVIGLIAIAFRRIYEIEVKGNPTKLYQKDSTTGIPQTLIGNFINCCISITFDAKYNSRDYSDYFKVFYLMAQCGPEVTGYLIKHKFIGRILDFFFDKVSPHNKFFREMTDVPYAENEKPAIGLMKEEKQRIRTALEEILARRKGRQFNESYASHRGYMWQTLSYLVRHCRLNKTESKRSIWQIGELDLDVISEEKVLLTPEAYFVLKVLEDCNIKVAIKSCSLLYAYLCYEDEKFTDVYVEAIKKGLDKEVSELRPYFRALYQLLALEDSLSAQRCSVLTPMLCKIAKDNSNYYLETDAFTTFAYKLASRNNRVREWFLNNKDQWAWMVQWLQQHQNPPTGVVQSGMKIQKRRLGLREMKAHIALKTRRFQEMVEGSIENCSDHWDSDDDISEIDFKAGQQFDYLDLSRNKWTIGTVDTMLEEMINLSFNNEATWITCDSELLAPLNTMRIHQEILEKEGQKLEEAEAPAPIVEQGQVQGQSQAQNQGPAAPEHRYNNVADDSDSDSVDMLI